MTRALLFPLFAATVLSACADKSSCDIDEKAKSLAGSAAVFCGRVMVDGLRTEVDACVRTQLGAKKAFWARYDTQNAGTGVYETAEAIVGGADGRVSFLDYESSPCGSPGCDARITQELCYDPTVAQGDPRKPPVECAQRTDRKALCD